MAWFFIDEILKDDNVILSGETAKHISKSLRMRVGENITLCDNALIEHNCIIENIDSENVYVKVIESSSCKNEADVNLTLFQALPKGDKMETIIQKSVELGVYEIVPIITSRCVSRPDQKTQIKKVKRYQKISYEAACQSNRGIVPNISNFMNFNEVLPKLNNFDKVIVFYECGGESIKKIIKGNEKNIAIFVGSEGGFDVKEIEKLKENGAICATLGKRILRAETAPITAISVLMYETNNLN